MVERCQTCSTVTVTDLGGARFVCVKEEVWQSFGRPAWLEQLAFCKNQQNFLLQDLEAFLGNFAPVKISCYTYHCIYVLVCIKSFIELLAAQCFPIL